MKRKTSKADLKSGNPIDVAASEVINPWSMGNAEIAGLRELTIPPIVKVADMPVGAHIDGTITDVIPSRQKSIRNPLIIVQLTKDGNKVSLPAVASIANVLLPGYDDKKDSEQPEKKCPYIGTRVICRKVGVKESKQWKEDDQKTPRKFPVFDIFVMDGKGGKGGKGK